MLSGGFLFTVFILYGTIKQINISIGEING